MPLRRPSPKNISVISDITVLIETAAPDLLKLLKNFSKKVSVILPAYNEGAQIYNNLLQTNSVFQKMGINFEIILVDDCSTDSTLKYAKAAAQEVQAIELVTNQAHYGKGHALLSGLSHVTGDIIVFLDSDLDIHPAQLEDFFHLMCKEKIDVVIGSKHHPQSKINYPIIRKIISRIYSIVIFILFRLPLRDTQAGLKVFRTAVLRKVAQKALCKRFAFDVEILANIHRLGYKIYEMPIVLNFRREQKLGKIRLRDICYTALDTIAIFYRMYIVKYYNRIDKSVD